MKKRILIIGSIIIILAISFILIKNLYDSNKQNREKQNIERYNEIIKSFSSGMDEYIKTAFAIKNEKNCTEFISGTMTSDSLIFNKYLSKESMLDIDKKSYCKAIAKEYIVLKDSEDKCEMKYDVYLKCNNYATPGFDDLDYQSFLQFKDLTYNY